MPSMRSLLEEVESNPRFRSQLSEDPGKAIRDFSASKFRSPLDTDTTVYRIVVLALGTIGILAIAGCVTLGFRNGTKPPSEIITGMIALGSAAVGALAGLLAPQPRAS